MCLKLFVQGEFTQNLIIKQIPKFVRPMMVENVNLTYLINTMIIEMFFLLKTEDICKHREEIDSEVLGIHEVLQFFLSPHFNQFIEVQLRSHGNQASSEM